MIIERANLHVQNGSAQTYNSNGLGNLNVEYNEANYADVYNRIGSHNLVVGPEHEYTNYGGMVAGFRNYILATSTSAIGGAHNKADRYLSSISGGSGNTASGWYTSISGGSYNTANNSTSSVSGASDNSASQTGSTISGGYGLDATAYYDHVP